jgi:predicted HicB family RNase H-like nuclease
MEENKKVTSFGNRANNLLEEKVKIEDDILRQAEKILQEKKKREAETKKSNSKRKRVVFDCPPELHRLLKIEAAKREVTLRELIVEGIEKVLMGE